MLDKELIKSKFKKSILTYSNNAPIQKEIAQKLAGFINKDCENILEIGSYSGFLTKEIVQKINFKKYLAIDIIDSFDFIKNLNSNIEFINADIETFELKEKYDLIISSSTLQWCNDFSKVVKKLKSHLSDNGKIALAIFGNKNLYEIKETLGISLNYPDINDIKHLFSKNALIFDEIKTLKFNSSKDILRHLKLTGVNAIQNNYSYSEIKKFLKIMDEKYQNTLTYNPLYIIS